MQEVLPAAKLAFVTQQLNPGYVHAALEAGAMAYVSKPDSALLLTG
jgi:DNA-binding NarL/FixJ family response regulator